MRLGRCAAPALLLTAFALGASTQARAQDEGEVASFGASAHVQAPKKPADEVATQREVLELRATHGDSFSVVESAPSAVPVFSGVPYLLIRGAPPSGTATFYDGAPIPAFHHLALGPAIAHLSLVSSVRFHAGISPARYGRHIGGVHALEAPDVSPMDARAELELNAVDSQALAATHGERWIAAHTRYGFPNVWLDAIDAGVKLGYGDYQLRMVTPFGEDGVATLHAFGSYDALGEAGEPQDDIDLSFHRVVGRYVYRRGDTEVGSSLFAGYDRGELGQELTGSTLRMGPALYAERKIGADTRIRLGADLEGKLADVDLHERVVDDDAFVDEQGRPTSGDFFLPEDQRVQSIELGAEEFIAQSPLRDTLARTAFGAYVELELLRTKLLRAEVGLRADHWLLGGESEQSVDPRGVVRFVPSESFEAHVGAGTAHQSVASPVPIPGLDAVELDLGLQRAIQTELGVRFSDLLGAELEITGYYHRFYDTAFLELVLDCEGNSDSRVFDQRLPEFESVCREPGLPRADGENYGIELMLRPHWTDRLTGFVTYTLGGASAEAEDGTDFTPQADVRHLTNGVFGYDFGGGFRAGARLHYRSGKSAVNTFYNNLTSRFERTELRLPSFFRADVFVSYAFRTFAPTTITAGVQNVTFSREATKRDCQITGSGIVLCEIDYQPAIVLPNVGVRVEL